MQVVSRAGVKSLVGKWKLRKRKSIHTWINVNHDTAYGRIKKHSSNDHNRPNSRKMKRGTEQDRTKMSYIAGMQACKSVQC